MDPSSQNNADLKEQLLQAEKILHPGFHALCFVIDPNKITDLKDQFQCTMEYFGDDVGDYAFVIITFTKSEDDLEKRFPSIVQDKHAEFTSVFKFCIFKQLYIDNKVTQTEKEEMIKDIFASIDSANVRKFTPHFSSRFKQETQAAEALRATEALRAAEAAAAAEAVRAAKDAEDAIKAAEAAKTTTAMKTAEEARARADAFKAAAEAAAKAAKDEISKMAKAAKAERKAAEAERQREKILQDQANEAYKKEVETRQGESIKKLELLLAEFQSKANKDFAARRELQQRLDAAERRAAEAEARADEKSCTVM
ncbi:hypothetical protein DPMN_017822 [Dreissena polymorpha]|uniref:AIG1-type G domain-containing protein n=2 Tax=Dreissena polymorpha TaxID=45954 RepID=A0A9D4S8J9_DREPO|nr:hypothetical protein DPMN_017822 [Dreissena polymorpha]